MSNTATVSLRVLDTADVVLAGGSLAHCHLAVELARQDLDVIVTTQTVSLAPEMSSTLRVWIESDELEKIPQEAAGTLRSCLGAHGGTDGLLHLGLFTEALEDWLISAGVRFYYNAYPAGIVGSANTVAGVAVAGKFGVGIITAPVVVDGTPVGVLVRASGVGTTSRHYPGGRITQVMQHLGDRVERPSPDRIEVMGVHGPLIEYGLPQSIDAGDPLAFSRASVVMAQALIQEGERLPASPLRRADHPWFPPPIRLGVGSGEDQLRHNIVSDLDGLLATGTASGVDDETALRLSREPQFALTYMSALADPIRRYVVQHQGSARRPEWARLAPSSRDGTRGQDLCLEDPGFVEPGTGRCAPNRGSIPVVASRSIVVCGGGTAGAAAAAATGSPRTLCVEAAGDLGGVGTVGGVPHAWFGHWPRYIVDRHQKLKDLVERRHLPWSLALMATLLEAGVDVLPLVPIVGVSRGAGRIGGIIVGTAEGLGVIRGRRFIDATGDGDVAAWGGAPYTYGAERDEITLWCSFGKFRSDRRDASRLYYSVVDQRSLRDTTRAIVAGRRQVGVFGEGEFPQFTMATRESRHIRGRARLSYIDMIADAAPGPHATVFRSNIDIKGMASSDAAMCGFVERDFLRNWSARIPIAAVVPEGPRNLLVTGKAYSASHDALSMARMQPDIAALGAVAGLASARIPVGPRMGGRSLTAKMVRSGLIPEGRAPQRNRVTPGQLENWVSRLASGPVELDVSTSVLRCADLAIPVLQAALRGEPRRPVEIARALAVLREPSGADVLLSELRRLLDEGPLPGLWSRQHHDMPDHGWSPDPVYLINALGLIREQRLLPLLEAVVHKLSIGPDLTDHRFSYVHSISYALEHIAVPEGAAILSGLLSLPPLHGRELLIGRDPRLSADHVWERCAYLELCLARALARCAGPGGYETLIRYLGDQRVYLARSAYTELLDLTNQDRAFDLADWMTWLSANRHALKPQPYTRRHD